MDLLRRLAVEERRIEDLGVLADSVDWALLIHFDRHAQDAFQCSCRGSCSHRTLTTASHMEDAVGEEC